jgi:hypothetical protein
MGEKLMQKTLTLTRQYKTQMQKQCMQDCKLEIVKQVKIVRIFQPVLSLT